MRATTDLRLYDRLYKQMEFPPIILDLLDCPGLLRLRDVRMANNQFFAFPAFANSSRYEHSLGVCYLAGICADKLGLSEKDKLELMIAALYHDVSTPPFAHAMEEVLMAKFNFDHEGNLKKLIVGDTGDFDQDFAQVYLGQSLKLKSVCQSKKASSLGIDPHRIARIAVGDKSDILSPLINGKGMDLDNIDNICRAVSAMGIIKEKVDFSDLAITLASSFVLKDDTIYYNRKYAYYIEQWLQLRDIQYTEIYRSIEDFSYQAMIKKALRLLGTSEGEVKLEKNMWRLTDSVFTYQYLLKDVNSKPLMERVLLCKPYPPLALLYIRGKGAINYVNMSIQDIENEVVRFLTDELGFKNNIVLANFYPDKRHRWIPENRWVGSGETPKEKKWEEGLVLGLFTPAKIAGYTSDSGTNSRTLRRFDNTYLSALINKLQGLLSQFEVMEYGEEVTERNTSNHGQNQLGF